MTTSAPPVAMTPAKTVGVTASDAKKRLTSPWASLIAIIIAVLWTIPTVGLLITSFRRQLDIQRTGWWTAFTHPFSEPWTLDNYRRALTT